MAGDRRPVLRLLPGQGKRLKAGAPWAYSNEIAMRPELRAHDPGVPVALEGDDGARFGTFAFNPHSLIAARLLDRNPDAGIDQAWFTSRIAAAALLRARLVPGPFHRLVHAEADGMPGLVVDRFGEVLAVQQNSAAMERWGDLLVVALQRATGARAIVGRNDSESRKHEGLAQEIRLLHGTDAAAVVEEGGVRFAVDLLAGQKTGFFFDQRPNRDRVAALASGATVLDVFCHGGAFGLRALAAGAARATLVDSSAPALALAEATARANSLSDRLAVLRGDAFDTMAMLDAQGARFDIVIVDPPAFIKRRADHAQGLRAYGKTARLAAALVAPGGFLFAASCSHHASAEEFFGQVAWGLRRAERDGRIVWSGGAGPDHPVHPHLPESAYLKAQLVALA